MMTVDDSIAETVVVVSDVCIAEPETDTEKNQKTETAQTWKGFCKYRAEIETKNM